MSKTQVLDRHPHPKFPRLTVQRRSNSRFYQAVTFLDGKIVQKSTGTDHLPTAFKLAEDFYTREVRSSVSFGLQHPIARLTADPTVAELFSSYCTALDARKQGYAKMRWGPIAPFWKARLLSTVDTGTFRDFFVWRRRTTSPITNGTLHKDTVLVRQILKYALDQEMLTQLPRIPPVGTVAKNPRPWFTPAEWSHLMQTATERRNAVRDNKRLLVQRQNVLELTSFLGASMLRVGELRSLRFHQCRVETNANGDRMLLAEVSGKRGTRTVVANAVAAEIYTNRLQHSQPGDKIFKQHCRDGFRELLEAAGLRTNDQGFTRNLKSVRATSISTALLNNPELNLIVVARNAGTSLAMIDDFYAKRLTAEMHKNELSTMPNLSRDTLIALEAEEASQQLMAKVQQFLAAGGSPTETELKTLLVNWFSEKRAAWRTAHPVDGPAPKP
jgi:integrase